MDKAYTWHSGNYPVAPIIPTPTPLLPDEIFTSWFIRLALECGSEPLSLSQYFWPAKRIWTQDIDRLSQSLDLKKLFIFSGIKLEAITESFLNTYLEKGMESKDVTNFHRVWLIPLGSRNRKRTLGLQYCPLCFSEDKIPYIRIDWRYSWYTICNQHKIYLHQTCNKCNALYLPHMLLQGTKSIAVCHKCDSSLARSRVLSSNNNPLKEAACLQLIIREALLSKKLSIFNITVSTFEWFDIFYRLIQLTRLLYRRNNKLIMELVNEMVDMPDDQMGEKLIFSNSNIGYRTFLIALCYKSWFASQRISMDLLDAFVGKVDDVSSPHDLLDKLDLVIHPKSHKKHSHNKKSYRPSPLTSDEMIKKWLRLIRKYKAKNQ